MTTEATLVQLRGVARLLLLHTDLRLRLKGAEATGRLMPTLRQIYGQTVLFSGYGPRPSSVRVRPPAACVRPPVQVWAERARPATHAARGGTNRHTCRGREHAWVRTADRRAPYYLDPAPLHYVHTPGGTVVWTSIVNHSPRTL